MLILEGAQAGLSWITILRKRPAYRRAFSQFDPKKVARYDAAKRRALLRDPGIVRNRLKIDGAVKNARAFLEVQRERGSFDAVHLAVRRRHAKNQSATIPEGCARDDAGIGCDEPGLEEARLHVRRIDHLLRVHAGRRSGRRPRGDVFQSQAAAFLIASGVAHSFRRAKSQTQQQQRHRAADHPADGEPRQLHRPTGRLDGVHERRDGRQEHE